MDPVLKKRLIGALALIALAVIFLPMLIKGPAPDSGVGNVSTKVPSEPDGQFVEIPLATPDAGKPDGGAVGMPVPVPTPAASAAPLAAAGVKLPATTAAGDYAVNFGAYASQADADTVAANLKQAGLPAYTATDMVGGKPAVRVRIGNYEDRAQAEIVRLQALKLRNDVKASVVALDAAPATPAASKPVPVAPAPKIATESLPPEPKPVAKPAPAPEKPVATTKPAETPKPVEAPKPQAAAVASGFAVQLGAFASTDEANALRDKARSAGFSAFVEQVRTDKGVLARVRVGPVASRDDADKLKAQITAKLGVTGMVRPHP